MSVGHEGNCNRFKWGFSDSSSQQVGGNLQFGIPFFFVTFVCFVVEKIILKIPHIPNGNNKLEEIRFMLKYKQ